MNGQTRRPPLPLPESTPPPQCEWAPRLAHAHSQREVLDLCAERLAALDARDIDSLPQDCRPVEIEDGTDLAVYALTLVRRQTAAPSCPALLASLAEFFALANVRMAQVLRHKDDEREADAWLSRMDRRGRRDPGSQAVE